MIDDEDEVVEERVERGLDAWVEKAMARPPRRRRADRAACFMVVYLKDCVKNLHLHMWIFLVFACRD